MRGGFNAILRIACPYANPNLQIGMVFEIDRGTRVLTHSPTARHQRRHYRRYQPLSVCAVTSGLRRQYLRSTNSVGKPWGQPTKARYNPAGSGRMKPGEVALGSV